MAHRIVPLMSISVLLAACQAGPSTAQATRPGSGDAVVTWYTHEGAEALYRAAKYEDAIKVCKEAVGQLEKAKGKESPEVAEPLIDLATVYMRQAKYAEAKTAMDRAGSLLHAEDAKQALLVGRLAINKGWRLYTFGETAAAGKVFAEGRALLEKYGEKTGPSAKDLAELINNEALMLEETASEQNDEEGVAKAKRMLLQSWQMRRKLCGDQSPEVAESLNNLGMHLLFYAGRTSDLQLAESTLKKALELSVQLWGENHPDTAMAHTNVALAGVYMDQFEVAQKEMDQALPVTVAYFGNQHPDRAYELGVVGRIAQERKKYEAAEKAFTEAVAINEAVYGKNSPNIASSLRYLSSLYEATGNTTKQEEVERRIEKLSGGDL